MIWRETRVYIHRSSREGSIQSQITEMLQESWGLHPGWLSKTLYLQSSWVSECTHLLSPRCPARALCLCVFLCLRTFVLGLGSWGHLCSVTNGFHMQPFTHSSAHFPQMLLLGSPSGGLVCWHPQPDCSTALFHPFASEEVIYLSQEI